MEHLLDTPVGIEGRAKIMWGESPQKVSTFLAENNLSQPEISYIIDDALADRFEEIREAGKSLLYRSGISFIVFVTCLCLFMLGIAGLALIYAIIMLIVGLPRFLSGKASGDVSKMTGMFG